MEQEQGTETSSEQAKRLDLIAKTVQLLSMLLYIYAQRIEDIC